MLFAPAYSNNVADPGAGTIVTVQNSIVGRMVFGHVVLIATASNSARIAWQIETSPGSGSYDSIICSAGAGLTQGIQIPFSFYVPSGCRYRYVKQGLSGVTETLTSYFYVDM